MLKKKLDKEGRKFITPLFPGGIVTPEQLKRIADVCEKFPESKIKLSGEIVIGGIKDEERNEELRKMLALPVFNVAGFSVRPVKVCAGGFLCDNNLQDCHLLGEKLDVMFRGKELPFKMIIAVSGCSRSCSESLVKDIGIVASKKGYSVFVGGAAGARPRVAEKLVENISEQEVIEIVKRIVSFYQEKGKTPERLGLFIDRIGFERFKEKVSPPSLFLKEK